MSNPKEYIERGLYCETICRCNGTACDKSKCPIWNAPVADVATVVRCMNCRHALMVVDIIGNPQLFCGLSCNKAQVDFDDFCSYGERKEK